MQNLPNIDPSRFYSGAYVGYTEGTVWTIVRYGRGWRATVRGNGRRYDPIVRATLAQVSVELQRLSDAAVLARQRGY